jgi:hypothetical protein
MEVIQTKDTEKSGVELLTQVGNKQKVEALLNDFRQRSYGKSSSPYQLPIFASIPRSYGVSDVATLLYLYLASLAEPLIPPVPAKLMMSWGIEERDGSTWVNLESFTWRYPWDTPPDQLVLLFQRAVLDPSSANRRTVVILLDLFAIYIHHAKDRDEAIVEITETFCSIFFGDMAGPTWDYPSATQASALDFLIEHRESIFSELADHAKGYWKIRGPLKYSKLYERRLYERRAVDFPGTYMRKREWPQWTEEPFL